MHKPASSPLRRLILKATLILPFLVGIPQKIFASLQKRFPTRTVDDHVPSFSPETGNLRTRDGKSFPYELLLDGLVKTSVTFRYSELLSLPQHEQTSDFHCVEGWSVEDVIWQGITPAELFSHLEILPEAQFCVFHSLGATPNGPGGLKYYIESLPLSTLLDPKQECLFALKIDGEPLLPERGAPLRVIAPYQLAYKSSKFVHRISFSEKKQDGWWTVANPIYPWDAPVPKSRLRKRNPA
ncbi:molybdopterin-dependent oxidoreductase [Desulfobaculum bizertense]|uniref:Oxidoreductase molybdopterin binding domain-containing protein n=1 Tax=Desulfobaculum bizertense DSM 18034 TaxID=1121442 RepID=A0A1T4WLF0_9BACT|nr:molybdopterin-dependent oxidoreductase [Desulfobaculum bizertense]SKA78163.1 Oxidoreductase molybdopterin binding domain-containing protein [Desulfobaculum bizertense DSM 18034]